MVIKFLNWDKYNKRQKDIVRPFWYAMSNRFFYDPDFMDFTSDEKVTFFFLLGEASQQNKYGEVSVNEEFYSRITGLNKRVLFNTFDKLLKSGAAAGCRQDGGGITTATEQNKTEQNKTEHIFDHFKNDRKSFDFEILYKKYPRKVGKTEGLQRLRAMITTDEDYRLFSLAIDNYISYLKKSGTMPQYVKHFSSFVGTGAKQSWRDWLDADAGKAEELKKEHDYSFLKE